ncbi:hypothetical protein E2C01_003625 [Portunus trituberculatus]|uniref:Uncharacterized protein n=1 Tax=Portunus trituberculatus TaxID=210409 RepID=A0A5B7CMW8_PORTR|nr:hypothetical protein [Portunus trituberculatus]
MGAVLCDPVEGCQALVAQHVVSVSVITLQEKMISSSLVFAKPTINTTAILTLESYSPADAQVRRVSCLFSTFPSEE